MAKIKLDYYILLFFFLKVVNVCFVVCLFVCFCKVYRVKNKWKFLLKDGVMHLNGYDYVFHKVSGEADW